MTQKKHLGSEMYATFSKHGAFEHHGSVLPHENSGILYLEKCKLYYSK